MRMIGEKPRGGTLDSNEQVECLAELNTMLESWNLERLMAYSVTQDTHALTASTATYTIGPGATINTARPVKIVDPCWTRDANGYDSPLTVVNLETYGKVGDKSSAGVTPQTIYYNGDYSSTSTASLTLYPPPGSGLTLHIHSWKQLTAFASVSSTVLLPPGYQLAIESNFAIHLAAGFREVSKEVAEIARKSKAAIKKVNTQGLIMGSDLSATQAAGENIFTG